MPLSGRIPGRTLASHQVGVLFFLRQHILILGLWSQEMPVDGNEESSGLLVWLRGDAASWGHGRQDILVSLFSWRQRSSSRLQPRDVHKEELQNTGSLLTTQPQLRVHPLQGCKRAPSQSANLQTSPWKWTTAAFTPSLGCPVLRIYICLMFCPLKASLLTTCSPRGNRSCRNCRENACWHLTRLYSFLRSQCSFGHCSAPMCVLCQQLKQGMGNFFQCWVTQAWSFAHPVQYFFIKYSSFLHPDTSKITVAELFHYWQGIFILCLGYVFSLFWKESFSTMFFSLVFFFTMMSFMTSVWILPKELSRWCRGQSVFQWLNTKFGVKSWNNLSGNCLPGKYLKSEKLP